ncbi:MAG: hypothetical protein U0804_28570 [Gemmataceae bacterium]
MTAAPARTADLPLDDQLRLAEWMAAWPLLSEDEARRELGLPAAPRHLRNPNANTPPALAETAISMAFCSVTC